jgi:hypothetical protein
MSRSKKDIVVNTEGSLPDLVKEAICFYKGCYPEYSFSEICRRVNRKITPLDINEDLVVRVIEAEPNLVAKYRKGGAEAVKMGMELKELKYATLYSRVQFLAEVMDMGKSGYSDQKVTGRGDVIELVSKNLSASLEAHKQLTAIMFMVEGATEVVSEEDYVDVAVYPQFLEPAPNQIEASAELAPDSVENV